MSTMIFFGRVEKKEKKQPTKIHIRKNSDFSCFNLHFNITLIEGNSAMVKATQRNGTWESKKKKKKKKNQRNNLQPESSSM